METKAKASCSWCWKGASEVAVLIQGHGGAYICDECAELCAEIVGRKKANLGMLNEPSSEELSSRLDEALARLRGLMEVKEPSGPRPPPLRRS